MPDDLDSRLALAEIYERLDMREEALDLVNEGKYATRPRMGAILTFWHDLTL